MIHLRLCFIGFGHAGQALARLLLNQKESLARNYGCRFSVTAITTRSRGGLVVAEGIDLKRVLENIQSQNRFPTDDSARSTIAPTEMIRTVPADVVVEMTPLNISSGEPALTHIQTALSADRHVITLNKGPIARSYQELRSLAENSQKRLLFEGTVMDGFPVFNLVRETLHGCRILGFRGVLNSTTNFILGGMEQGKSFSETLAEAQRLGIAEADADQDLDGWDAATKTAALINVLMNGATTPEKIDREGIRHLTSEDLRKARRQGKILKLVCEARQTDGLIDARVSPVPLPLSDSLARTEGTSSTLTLFTDMMGPVTLFEESPGISQTAYAVLSDLLTLVRNINPG